MECRLKLRCLRGYGQSDPAELLIPLRRMYRQEPAVHEESPEDRIGEICLLEEGVYTCRVTLSGMISRPLSIELFLNNEPIAFAQRLPYTLEDASIDMSFKNDFDIRDEGQPFLLQYDLVRLSLCIETASDSTDAEYSYYTSDYLPCLSKFSDNAENKEAILKALFEFDDDRISDLMFPAQSAQTGPNTFLQGGWQKNSYKSLGSYIQMIETVCRCYEQNYPSFKNNVKHTIAKRSSMESYRNIRNITTSSLQWLFQNSEQLTPVDGTTAVQLHNRYYMPYQMRIEKSIKSFDIYENRIVLGFLQLVYNHARYIESQLKNDIESEDKLVNKLQQMERDGMRMSVIPVKRIQIQNNRVQIQVLQRLILTIEKQYPKYQEILRCFEQRLTGIPQKTKIFQEVQPYRHIFEQIMEWYRFGEFRLLKENLIFNIKTMDTLFEYYCLYKLLLMLQDAGFLSDKTTSAYHTYKPTLYPYQCDIANTYQFQKDGIRITLYYQPVIRSDGFENNITLYRTTSFHDCYTPDFMFKIEIPQEDARYVIMDAKYSTSETIRKYYIDKTIIKYSCQVSGKEGNTVKLVWLLQGRMDFNARNTTETMPFEKYHNSPLASKYKPNTSYAIIPINNKTDMSQIWDEICAAAFPESLSSD
ncbi:MAG: DUF2357 domain-containing protein [Spirochaetaceae bacterium]|jgi:hypothetical protein|nr:DUF2357 domain-containing protein [Spirochaetaceae bacterium]